MKVKAVIYFVIFIAASVLTYIFTIGKTVSTSDTHSMTSAGLPVVYMSTESGLKYNYLRGYTGEVDETQMHDAITPVDASRMLNINVKQYGCAVSGVAYELWTVDMKTLVERAEGVDYSGKDGVINATLEFKNLIAKGQEYLLKIKLNTESYESVCYYTRLVKLDNASVENRLSYVDTFSENTRKDETLGKVTAKLEPNSSGDNTNLGRVNIHSKLSQVGFSNLELVMRTLRRFTITEIDETRTSILLTYKADSSDETGDFRYNITEFFRIYQPDNTVTYVYNFERWMDQVFTPSKGLNSKGEVYLGIRSDTDVNMKSSSNGNITAFELDGNLWVFSAVKNSFSKVFTFEELDTDGIREEYKEYGIKILNVYNNGNVDYLVYGYMNRGPHEGEIGISVFKFETTGRTSKEIIFIPRTDCYEIIAQDVEELAYLTSENMFYMYSNGAVYYLDCNTKEYMITDMNIIPELSQVSEGQSIYVYQTGNNHNACKDLKILYLSTGEIYTLKADSDEYIKMLGYIDGNIVYGKSFTDMLYVDSEGKESLPLYTVIIMDKDRKEVRRYGEDKIYIIDADFTAEQIVFKRVKMTDEGTLIATHSDSLLSGSESSRKSLEVITEETDFRQKEQYISMIVGGNGRALVYECKFEYSDKSNVMISDIYKQDTHYYYAYAFGMLAGLYDNLADAIVVANDGAGVVVNSNAERIWDRYKATSYKLTFAEEWKTMTNEIASSYVLTHKGTDKDLSGNTIDAAMYYVAKGNPIIAKTGNGVYELVYRYDSKNVYTYELSSHKEKAYTKEKFDQLIAGYGSVLIIY